MSTRGNYVFIRYPIKEDENGRFATDDNGDFVIDEELRAKLYDSISDDDDLIKDGNKVYVHWDNYPSYAVPRLLRFLRLQGAQDRLSDRSYLSAWFVTYVCTEGKDVDWESKSFTGCGLENHLSDWADYTYVICPCIEKRDGIEYWADYVKVFVYNHSNDYIGSFLSSDCLEDIEASAWYR